MNILIVEDEAPAARRLERFLAGHFGAELRSVASVESVDEARRVLDERRVDLILLDLDLAGENGFDVIAGSAGDQGDGPPVIVVSARSDRAIDAFDHAVVDFVTKPVSEERLARALARAGESAKEEAGASLVVRSAGRIDLAPAAAIVALSGADDYVEVALADGRRLLHDASLDTLQKRLPATFLRVHRSHIVNAARVKAMRASGGARVLEMSDGTLIPVSRRRANDVSKALKATARTKV
jgi:DNA-binding LytR/AlgR family response regulator